MNPVLTYATEHQQKACAALVYHWGIPPDDVDDVCQQAFMRILERNLSHITKPTGYWYRVLRSAAVEYWRRQRYRPVPFSVREDDNDWSRDSEDLRQDVGHQAEVAEALRQVRDVCRTATSKERDALAAKVGGEPMDNARNQRLFHLRKRLRAAVA